METTSIPARISSGSAVSHHSITLRWQPESTSITRRRSRLRPRSPAPGHDGDRPDRATAAATARSRAGPATRRPRLKCDVDPIADRVLIARHLGVCAAALGSGQTDAGETGRCPVGATAAHRDTATIAAAKAGGHVGLEISHAGAVSAEATTGNAGSSPSATSPTGVTANSRSDGARRGEPHTPLRLQSVWTAGGERASEPCNEPLPGATPGRPSGRGGRACQTAPAWISCKWLCGSSLRVSSWFSGPNVAFSASRSRWCS